jgi:hypothetical protein
MRKTGRPSIAPEKLLRAQLIQMLYSVRSERLLMEEIDYSMLYRWFVIAHSDARYKRGIRDLQSHQLEDGSWYLRWRAPSFQPYFDSEFLHGHDQFISAATTNWATMALLTVVR